jgi:hypothetical protein
MAAIRARITDQLMPLIKSLCGVERMLRAEPEKPVRMPLQFGQIVQKRWPHALRFGLYGFNGGSPVFARATIWAGFNAIGWKPRGFLNVRTSRTQVPL